MNEAEFWNIIDFARYSSEGDGEKQAEHLIEYLSQMSEGDILDFDYIFEQYHTEAYDRNLWEAALIIEGLCSDDGFADFRAGLIGRGQAIYEAALAEPESLVDLVEGGDYISVEALNYVAWKAYEIKTGDEYMPVALMNRSRKELEGEWSKYEDWPIKFPILSAKFLTYWENL